jgi:cell division inhibitor SulA
MRQLQLGIKNPEISLASSLKARNNPSETQAGISEIILASDSALQPIYLLPILSQMALDKRWLMWLADEPSINRTWLTALGIDASQVLHIYAEPDCFHQVCCKALAAGTGHLIIEWPGQLSEQALAALEAAAKLGNSHALLIRRR